MEMAYWRVLQPIYQTARCHFEFEILDYPPYACLLSSVFCLLSWWLKWLVHCVVHPALSLRLLWLLLISKLLLLAGSCWRWATLGWAWRPLGPAWQLAVCQPCPAPFGPAWLAGCWWLAAGCWLARAWLAGACAWLWLLAAGLLFLTTRPRPSSAAFNILAQHFLLRFAAKNAAKRSKKRSTKRSIFAAFRTILPHGSCVSQHKTQQNAAKRTVKCFDLWLSINKGLIEAFDVAFRSILCCVLLRFAESILFYAAFYAAFCCVLCCETQLF